MESKDLRIGNSIYNNGIIIIVSVFDLENLEKGGDYKPILLSKYIKIKWDFLEITFNDKMRVIIDRLSNVTIHLSNGTFKFEKYYLHQLQNFYYCHFGEELEI